MIGQLEDVRRGYALEHYFHEGKKQKVKNKMVKNGDLTVRLLLSVGSI